MESNKKIGNKTEKVFAEAFHEKGWWVHIFADKVSGQPCDIVMAKNESVFFLDIKHVKGKDYLLHSRIEENQINAFKMLVKSNVKGVGFAVYFEDIDDWYFLPFQSIDFKEKKTHRDDMRRILIEKD